MQEWLIAVFGALATVIIAMQTWILSRLVDHEKQLFRLVSDRESEKGTIARVHNDFEKRLRELEHPHRK